MLSLVAASAVGYTLPSAATPGAMVSRNGVVRMADVVDAVNAPNWGDAREGKPFGEADGLDEQGNPIARPVGQVRAAVEAYQPRGISDATVIKPQYIETDDEPWHSTCRSSVVITKDVLAGATTGALPFIAAEDALQLACSKAEDEKAVKAAMATAEKEGARKGSPAMATAEKLVKAFAKDKEAGLKARPKAPKTANGGGAGWDGMKRGLAKVHDNSVA